MDRISNTSMGSRTRPVVNVHRYFALFRFWWWFLLSLDIQQYSFSNLPDMKNILILAQLYSQPQPVIRGLFRRFGYRLTSIFSGESEKTKFGIFETVKWRIFDHIGSAQRRFWLYFPYYLPIRKYAWKMVQNWFFL